MEEKRDSSSWYPSGRRPPTRSSRLILAGASAVSALTEAAPRLEREANAVSRAQIRQCEPGRPRSRNAVVHGLDGSLGALYAKAAERRARDVENSLRAGSVVPDEKRVASVDPVHPRRSGLPGARQKREERFRLD